MVTAFYGSVRLPLASRQSGLNRTSGHRSAFLCKRSIATVFHEPILCVHGHVGFKDNRVFVTVRLYAVLLAE